MSVCAHDYKALFTPASRRTQALLEARDAGIPRDRAVSYIALSIRETAVEWTTPRTLHPDGLLSFDNCECRTAVVLELKSGGFYFRDSANEFATRNWLQTNGYATWDGTGLIPTGGMLQGNSDAVAHFLEWIVVNKKQPQLDNISLGPTCQYLFFAFNALSCGWPQTWMEITSYYLENSVPNLLNRLTYLDPPCHNGGYPGAAANVGNDIIGRAFCTTHVGGNPASGATYYTTAYKNDLFVTHQSAVAIGY